MRAPSSPSRSRRAALGVALALASLAGAAPARAQNFVTLTAGAAFKPSGIARTSGRAIGLQAGRFVASHVALRLDADLLQFHAVQGVVWSPCPPTTVCIAAGQVVPSGTIAALTTMASLQVYERADRQGLYALAGFGPQWLLSHPTDRWGARLAVQLGGGLALHLGPADLVVEGRWQRALNAAGELRTFVPVTAGIRIGAPRL